MNNNQDTRPEMDEAAMMMEELVRALNENVPTKLCAPENRVPMAQSFIEMLGRLVAFLEQFKPMNHGQMAALLFFVDNLDLDRVGSDSSFIMLNLVGAAKQAGEKLKKLRSH